MILTSSQIKLVDERFVTEYSASKRSLVLKAANGAYYAMRENIDKMYRKHMLIVCGNGLNGADGYALALQLHDFCRDLKIFALPSTTTANELTNSFRALCVERNIGFVTELCDEYDTIIDCGFGISFEGSFDSTTSYIYSILNSFKAYKIAIDVPSGISADSGSISENTFRADFTIALCAKKICHLLYPSKDYCGNIEVADIGIDDSILQSLNRHIFELDGKEFNNIHHARSDIAYKNCFGNLGLVVGSVCYQGAATHAANAAVRCGVGITTAFIPDIIYYSFASKNNSAVIEPLNTINGGISDNSIPGKIAKRGCTAVLCGCGLGLTEGAYKAVADIAALELPVVFDGDALTIISQNLSLLDNRKSPTVLTPHLGEFTRLHNNENGFYTDNIIKSVTDFAIKHHCVVVLKDCVTIIADVDGKAYILSKPTSALSKAGSGDVLAGILASFIAQGMMPLDSAIMAVTLHNACGHILLYKRGAFYSQPDDLIEYIPELLR